MTFHRPFFWARASVNQARSRDLEIAAPVGADASTINLPRFFRTRKSARV